MAVMVSFRAVYQLKKDKEKIQRIQEATLKTEHNGLRQIHGLFGSSEWWDNINKGVIPLHRVKGEIIKLHRLYSDGEDNWTGFLMTSPADGMIFYPICANTLPDKELYKPGKKVVVSYVMQQFKKTIGDIEFEEIIQILIG